MDLNYVILDTVLAACMGIWIIFMHRSNIQRLRAGNENKFSFTKNKKEK
jgi:glycerol-3-phosphate acyltransferase PlsY